jgi:DNA polymerase
LIQINKLLEYINLSREDLYITNVLKCHPPKNHNPRPEEIKACISYLYEQIKIIQPEIIITLGKFAMETLFEKVFLPFSKISDMHGKIFEIKASYGKVKIIPLYHPSTACYNTSMIDVLKQDFKNSIGKLLSK